MIILIEEKKTEENVDIPKDETKEIKEKIQEQEIKEGE